MAACILQGKTMGQRFQHTYSTIISTHRNAHAHMYAHSYDETGLMKLFILTDAVIRAQIRAIVRSGDILLCFQMP